jgi:ATP-dependent helicase/nuclease subunit A
MNPVEFISAGAGSGKTYRLTQIVSDALADGTARPQAILATTFTIKAAAELRERARSKLLESGRVDLASAVGQARIGTVNGVCGQLLTRFCFEVGMSPDQVVLDKPQAERLLKATLDQALNDDNRTELVELSLRFAFDDHSWAKPIAAIVDAARENVISAEALRVMGAANADAMLANWPAPVVGVDRTAALVSALGAAAVAAQAQIDERTAGDKKVFKYMHDDLDAIKQRQRDFSSGNWTWQTWASTATLKSGKENAHILPPVHEAAAAHEVHPQFHADVRRYMDLVFNLAADTLEAYAQVKLGQGALDFVDQGVLLLGALRDREEVRHALADELDLVVVDEFQDTNPLQLAIFVELAKLAKRSVWVGDPKQAIYAFRGTDPTLIARIVESIEGWGGKLGERLSTSRRSTPGLVALSNAVFGEAFSPAISRDAVCLEAARDDIDDRHVALHNWKFESRWPTTDYLGLGVAVSELLAGKHKVLDKETKVVRPLQAGDIAILCRSHKAIALTVASLSRCGVPSASGRPGLLSTPEALFVIACLRRLQDPTDTVASALIVSLSSGMAHSEWLNDRLEFLAGDGKKHQWQAAGADAHPLLARLEELRPRLRALTPSEALRLAKSEAHIAQLASRWSHTPQEAGTRIANVEALLAMAKTYEDECVSARQPATVGGLLQWLRAQAKDRLDARAVAAEGAVTVLTHHAAKGLEWPVVVLTGLEEGARTALWGVRARTNGEFDAQAPLRGRFVHYWPYPYGSCKAPAAAADAEGSPLGLAMEKDGQDENLRLFYVSVTRARDTLILASTTRKGALDWVDEVKATPLLIGDPGTVELPSDKRILRDSRAWTAAESLASPEPAPAQELCWYTKGELAKARPLWFQPSAAQGGSYCMAEFEPVGERIAITAAVDMEYLGQALHLCIAKAGAHGGIGTAEVADILARWGVDDAVAAESVLAQMQAFKAWVEKRWPGCPVHVEVPLEVNLDDGVRLRGRIDFLVDTPGGWVLLDHKANPRGAARDDALIQKHGQQLDSYADALLRATGRPVLEQWLFLPVAGQAARVELAGEATEMKVA